MPHLQVSSGATFQQDNAGPYVALLPHLHIHLTCPPTEHVRDVDQRPPADTTGLKALRGVDAVMTAALPPPDPLHLHPIGSSLHPADRDKRTRVLLLGSLAVGEPVMCCISAPYWTGAPHQS
ncbi:hypothetical protein MHYP_G00061910 [Metynnis hypsauchen]